MRLMPKIHLIEVAFECDDESASGIERCIARLREAVEAIDEPDMGFEVATEVSEEATPLKFLVAQG